MDSPESNPVPSNIHLVEEYLSKTTWKGAENANSTYSHQGLMQHVSGSIISSYWLNHIYSAEIRQYVAENRFHIHDLGFLSAYCSGWSIADLLLQGFGGVPNKIQCRPPNHLNTALNQAVNFLFTLQGELAGAQALSNLDTYLAPFIRADGLGYKEVFKYVQSFVYSLNVPTRSGFQVPFTNISLDLVCPKSLESQPVILGGEYHVSWTYGDFQPEIDTFNRAFTAVMVQGDGNGNIFSFPIPTYNLTPDFDWESPRYDSIWEMTAKYGVPYFANFINSDLNPEDFRSMCCRLRLDVRKLHSRAGGLFGAAPLTGSLGVVTLNLPNLALRCDGTKEGFLSAVDDALRVAKESLEQKRKVVDGHSELYPYASHYLSAVKRRTGSHWTNHFSTIGVIGMHEALSILLDSPSPSDPAGVRGGGGGGGIVRNRSFALAVLEFIKTKLQSIQASTGHLYNLEATPAESTCYKLARRDRALFPSRASAGGTTPGFYTNSTLLPVGATEDLFQALDHQEELQRAYTGGTVFHAFLGERLPGGGAQARDLLRSIASRYRVPYVSLTPTFSVCPAHGYQSGETPSCPRCRGECLVYSRIVGYYRPTRDWNVGKKEEFGMRKYYDLGGPAQGARRGDGDAVGRGSGSPADDVVETREIDLPVAGFVRQTFSDYPGKIQASIMFTSRCNLACPWCHNGPVVRGSSADAVTAADVLREVLASSHKSLVVSGGEPTIHKGLIPFLRLLKRSGVDVKLDTNGTNPSVLRHILEEGLVDFVAMDIKCALSRYKQVAGRRVDEETLEESIQLIKKAEDGKVGEAGTRVRHEFRTTVVPGLVDMEDLLEAKNLADGKLTLQRFRRGETNLARRFRSGAKEHTDEEWADIQKSLAR